MKSNEQKARELIECGDWCESINKCDYKKTGVNCYAYGIAMKMAEWKDQQLKENKQASPKMNEEEIQMVVLEAIDKIKHTNGIKGAARFASMNYSVYEVAMEVANVMNEKLSKE